MNRHMGMYNQGDGFCGKTTALSLAQCERGVYHEVLVSPWTWHLVEGRKGPYELSGGKGDVCDECCQEGSE